MQVSEFKRNLFLVHIGYSAGEVLLSSRGSIGKSNGASIQNVSVVFILQSAICKMAEKEGKRVGGR